MKTERIEFRNANGEKLVGLLHTPEKETNKIVVIVHGFTSGKDKPRFTKASEAFVKEGYAVFRFDFSACGESEGDTITIENQVEELNLALKLIEERGYNEFALMGHSLGGLDSINAYNNKIKTMVLLAPVTKAKKVPSSLRDEKYLKEVEEKGYTIFERDGKKYKIPKKYFDERKSFNSGEALPKVKCPVLILHGDNDKSIPLDDSKSAMQFFSPESKLEIIKGGDHRMEEHFDEIITKSIDWLKRWLK